MAKPKSPRTFDENGKRVRGRPRKLAGLYVVDGSGVHQPVRGDQYGNAVYSATGVPVDFSQTSQVYSDEHPAPTTIEIIGGYLDAAGNVIGQDLSAAASAAGNALKPLLPWIIGAVVIFIMIDASNPNLNLKQKEYDA